MLNFQILSLSAKDLSRSRACVPALVRGLRRRGHNAAVTDIRDLPPVWVDGRDIDAYPPAYSRLYRDVEAADGVVFAMPIYCYTMSSGAKALSEILSGALIRKPCAFVVAAGTQRSHLAVRDLMASMAFEQETLCYPKTVLVSGEEFMPGDPLPSEISDRLDALCEGFGALVERLIHGDAEAGQKAVVTS